MGCCPPILWHYATRHGSPRKQRQNSSVPVAPSRPVSATVRFCRPRLSTLSASRGVTTGTCGTRVAVGQERMTKTRSSGWHVHLPSQHPFCQSPITDLNQLVLIKLGSVTGQTPGPAQGKAACPPLFRSGGVDEEGKTDLRGVGYPEAVFGVLHEANVIVLGCANPKQHTSRGERGGGQMDVDRFRVYGAWCMTCSSWSTTGVNTRACNDSPLRTSAHALPRDHHLSWVALFLIVLVRLVIRSSVPR